MEVPFVELERLVARPGVVVEELAAGAAVALSAVPCRISTGSVIVLERLARSRSSARTSAATVAAGWLSCAISGSLLSAATTFGSREKSSFFSLSTGKRGATWLSPLIADSAKSGAGTWKAKLSQMSPASSDW